MRWGRCACSGSCCPTWSGCSARTTPTPSPPGAASRAGPASAGIAAGALRLFRELLPDLERVLGPDHPDTLTTRGNIARWTGECGDAAGALRLFRELLPDRSGSSAPTTPIPSPPGTTSRTGLASAATGGGAAPLPGAAARPGADPRPGPPRHPDHPEQHRRTGPASAGTRGALRLYRELLPDRERVLGPDHPETLITRNNIATIARMLGGITVGSEKLEARTGCKRARHSMADVRRHQAIHAAAGALMTPRTLPSVLRQAKPPYSPGRLTDPGVQVDLAKRRPARSSSSP